MNSTPTDNCKPPRIGLALSGGGFRASLFHLGVIRRLEELGIMKHIHTISAVSGGSIIAAYYVIEMEKRLRRRREQLTGDLDGLDEIRLEIFEEIADCFFQALDHNLRSRATVFSPFYHPLLFMKSWWPGYSRSDIIQKEFDKWFYHDETLDRLPAVTMSRADEPFKAERMSLPLTGPTVVLNATSLLTGERKGFTRESVSRMRELHRVNRNTLKLSRVVGASSGVPGVFPPTTISGDKLVDGGVSDNQGIDPLVSLDRVLDRVLSDDRHCPAGDRDNFEVLLVSDASGQMELKHQQTDRAFKVMLRTVSIFQFQLRKKILKILRLWRGSDNSREFAFVHLFLNLKDRSNTPRVPTEYITALGAIRTDLDQFSFIERETLMFHGYTLIDAQINKYCKSLKALIPSDAVRLRQPPLFRNRLDSDQAAEQCASETKLRKRVKDVLRAGSGLVFLFRSRRKYPQKSWLVFGPALSLFIGGSWAVQHYLESLHTITSQIERWLSVVVPNWTQWIFNNVIQIKSFPLDTQVLTLIVWIAFWLYIVAFLAYVAMRRAVRHWDLRDYTSLTDTEPTVHWNTSDAA